MDAVVLRFCFCFLKMISFRISFVCHSVLLSWVQFVIRYLLRQCIFCMRDSPVFVCKLGFKNIFRIAFSNEGTLKFLSFPGGTFLSFFLPSRERVVSFFVTDLFTLVCTSYFSECLHGCLALLFPPRSPSARPVTFHLDYITRHPSSPLLRSISWPVTSTVQSS